MMISDPVFVGLVLPSLFYVALSGTQQSVVVVSSQVRNSVILMPFGYRNITLRYGNRQGKGIRIFTGVKESESATVSAY